MKPVSWSSLGVVAALWVSAAPSMAQEVRGVPRTLLDQRLQERIVSLTAINDKTVMYTDAAGQPRTETTDEFLAILPVLDTAKATAPARPASVLELHDGQRFIGTLPPGRTPPADSILWEHAAFGVLEFKLDQVRSVQLQGGPEAPARRPGEDATDIVLLINGDRIEGFVESVANQVIVEVNGAKRELPAERIQLVILGSGGPPTTVVPGPVVWLSDGSVVACRTIQTSRLGEVSLTPRTLRSGSGEPGTEAPPPPGPTVSLRLDDLWAIAVEPGSLLPLASLPVLAQKPAPGRRWARSAQSIDPRWTALGLADVELPGPMTIEWTLPPGAARFAAEATLPRQMWTWGDCEVIVSSTAGSGPETELWRSRINAESPRARVAVGLPAGARVLRIRVDAGQFGAVQDKVVLRRPVVGLTR